MYQPLPPLHDGFVGLCHLVSQTQTRRFFPQTAAFLAEQTRAECAQIFLIDATGRQLVLISSHRRGDSHGASSPIEFPLNAEQASTCPLAQSVFVKKTVTLAQYRGGYDLGNIVRALGNTLFDYIAVVPIDRSDDALLGVFLLAGNNPFDATVASAEFRLTNRAIAALVSARQSHESLGAKTDSLALSLARADQDRNRLRKRAGAALERQLPGRSRGMQSVRQRIGELARHTEPVLIVSQNGALSEVVARALHDGMNAVSGRFVSMAASGVPAERLGLDLFGHKRGAIPAVAGARRGLLREAAGGTLFIDRLDMLDRDAQAILKRLIEKRSFRPFGSERDIDLEARIVLSVDTEAISDLQSAFSSSGLMPLLGRMVIRIPALSDHPEDAEDIARSECAAVAERQSGHSPSFELSEDAIPFLRTAAHGYDRTDMAALVNSAIGRAMDADEPLSLAHLRAAAFPLSSSMDDCSHKPVGLTAAVEAFERDTIVRCLTASGGNRAEAADRLHVPKRTLAYKCRKYGL